MSPARWTSCLSVSPSLTPLRDLGQPPLLDASSQAVYAPGTPSLGHPLKDRELRGAGSRGANVCILTAQAAAAAFLPDDALQRVRLSTLRN